MPTKRKPGRWQDYKASYRIARRKGKARRPKYYFERSVGEPIQAERLSVFAGQSGVVLKIGHVRTAGDFTVDVQSELTTAFARVLVPHHGRKLAASAKSSQASVFAGIRQRHTSVSELEDVEKWYGGAFWSPSLGSGSGELIEFTELFRSTTQLAQASWQQTALPRLAEHWGMLFPSTRLFMTEEVDAAQTVGDWVKSPDAILQRLRDPSSSAEEHRLAILFAETMDFDDTQRAELVSLLHHYVLEERFTKDEDTQTAVGAAARKYAMNMDEPEFEAYAELLKPSQTQTLNHWIELELVKGVCWRISYEIVRKDHFPKLTAALSEIASDYVKPRLILQKNYTSTALHAIVAVVILRALSGEHEQAAEILEQVSEVGFEWFSELLEDRLEETIEAIEEHDPQLAASVRDVISAVN